MRYAIMSDIHGNIIALEACLKQIEHQQVEGFIFCGDYITDIPCPNEVLQRIKELDKNYPCYIIKGNREDYIIDYEQRHLDWKIGSNEEPLLWTDFDLFHQNFEYISKLPSKLSFTIDHHEVMLTHQSDTVTVPKMIDIMIVGHTHKQKVEWEKNTLIINPGSVGLGCYDGPGAYYSIIEFGKEVKVENYHIQYDIESVIAKIKQSYLHQIRSHWDDILILTLREGKLYSDMYINIMMDLAQKYHLDVSLDNIPPFVWNEGYQRLLQENK